MKEKKTEQLNIRIETSLRERINIQAEKEGRTESNLVYVAIREYLRNHGQKD